MRAILTANRLAFALLKLWRCWLNIDRPIIRDNARYVADGDWELWQDEGEAVG